MNLLQVIAAYAVICKAEGLPLRFPGTPAAADALYQMTDARLLGQAVHWAASTAGASGQAFNITNGDAFRWRHMFAVVAECFEMEYDPEPQTIRLEEQMPAYGPLWADLVRRHGLVDLPLDQLASWQFGDFIFHSGYDNVRSDLKARALGWNRFIDSEVMMRDWLTVLRTNRVVP